MLGRLLRCAIIWLLYRRGVVRRSTRITLLGRRDIRRTVRACVVAWTALDTLLRWRGKLLRGLLRRLSEL